MQNLIFGKTWEEIQQMQNGTYTAKMADLSVTGKPIATQDDIALLVEHDISGLQTMGFYGVIDRLITSGYIVK